MKKIFLISFFILTQAATLLAGPIQGQVLVNGEEVAAEFTVLSDGTVALGSGQNACIPQYTEGRVCVPSQITSGGTTYNVSAVSDLAFRFCNKLTFVEMKEGVKRIGQFAFVGCNQITEIILPSTLESIGSGAFIGLPLKNITCAAVEPPVWEYNDVFYFHEGGISDTHTFNIGSIRLTVPEESVSKYQSAYYTNPDLGWTTPEGWGCFTGYNDEFLHTYHVYTPQDLNALQEFVNIQDVRIENIVLEADIDMTGYTWQKGIGSFDNPYTGNFDGQGHTISNLHVDAIAPHSAGLFTNFRGEDKEIKNVVLKRCSFTGRAAGGVVGWLEKGKSIKNVYVNNCTIYGELYAGGLVGIAQWEQNIDKCAVTGVVSLKSSSTGKSLGGLFGASSSVNATNCAVMLTVDESEGKGGPFVGSVTNKSIWDSNSFNIDYSYYSGDNFTDYDALANKNIFGDHIIIGGKTPLTWNGNPRVFNAANIGSFMPASVLGLDNWVYAPDTYPLPDCFEDTWEVQVNRMTLRPASLTTHRLNALTPVGDIPSSAWLTNKEGEGHEYFEYSAWRLWIDETLSMDYGGYNVNLPIGKGKITATDGVIYDRTLQARENGSHEIKEPTYEIDDEGNLVLDENGNPIANGEQVVGEEADYLPLGYSIYLPYTAQLSPFCKLYQPRRVTTDNGETVVVFSAVADNQVEAYQPYYVVVEKESVPLSTEAEAVLPVQTDNSIALNGFQFVGTTYKISNSSASYDNAYILQGDGKWHRTDGMHSDAYIPAFRAYFTANADNNASALRIVFNDPGTTGITAVQNSGRSSEEGVWYTLDGQKLSGKPTGKGIYITAGRKVVIK